MTALTKSQRSKAFPAAKVAILQRYELTEVPKWSDVGTTVRGVLRQAMLEELRRGENDVVAEYFAAHEEEADQILHKRVKSLRENRGAQGIYY